MWALLTIVSASAFQQHLESTTLTLLSNTTMMLPVQHFFQGKDLDFTLKSGPAFLLPSASLREDFRLPMPPGHLSFGPSFTFNSRAHILFYNSSTIELWLSDFSGFAKVKTLVETRNIEGVEVREFPQAQIVYWKHQDQQVTVHRVDLLNSESLAFSSVPPLPLSPPGTYELVLCQSADYLLFVQFSEHVVTATSLYKIDILGLSLTELPGFYPHSRSVLSIVCDQEPLMLTPRGVMSTNVKSEFIVISTALGRLQSFHGSYSEGIILIKAERGFWVLTSDLNQTALPMLNRPAVLHKNCVLSTEKDAQGEYWLSVYDLADLIPTAKKAKLSGFSDPTALAVLWIHRNREITIQALLLTSSYLSKMTFSVGEAYVGVRGELGTVHFCAWERENLEQTACSLISVNITAPDTALIKQSGFLSSEGKFLTSAKASGKTTLVSIAVSDWVSGPNLAFIVDITPSNLSVDHTLTLLYVNQPAEISFFLLERFQTNYTLVYNAGKLQLFSMNSTAWLEMDLVSGSYNWTQETLVKSSIVAASIVKQDKAIKTEDGSIFLILSGFPVLLPSAPGNTTGILAVPEALLSIGEDSVAAYYYSANRWENLVVNSSIIVTRYSDAILLVLSPGRLQLYQLRGQRYYLVGEQQLPIQVQDVLYTWGHFLTLTAEGLVEVYRMIGLIEAVLLGSFALETRCQFQGWAADGPVVAVDCRDRVQVLDLSQPLRDVQLYRLFTRQSSMVVTDQGLILAELNCVKDSCRLISRLLRKHPQTLISLTIELEDKRQSITNVSGELTIFNEYSSALAYFTVKLENSQCFPEKALNWTSTRLNLSWSKSLDLDLRDIFTGADLKFSVKSDFFAVHYQPPVTLSNCSAPYLSVSPRMALVNGMLVFTRKLSAKVVRFDPITYEFYDVIDISVRSLHFTSFWDVQLLSARDSVLVMLFCGNALANHSSFLTMQIRVYSLDISTSTTSLLYSEEFANRPVSVQTLEMSTDLTHVFVGFFRSGAHHWLLEWVNDHFELFIQDLSWEAKYGIGSLGVSLIQGNWQLFAKDFARRLLVFDVQRDVKQVATLTNALLLGDSVVLGRRLLVPQSYGLEIYELPDFAYEKTIFLNNFTDFIMRTCRTSPDIILAINKDLNIVINVSAPVQSAVIAFVSAHFFYLLSTDLLLSYSSNSLIHLQQPHLAFPAEDRSDLVEGKVVITAWNAEGQESVELTVCRHSWVPAWWSWAAGAGGLVAVAVTLGRLKSRPQQREVELKALSRKDKQ